MNADPLLQKLDEILGRYFPSGPLDPVTKELRALMAEVAIEAARAYYEENHMYAHSPEGIRKRFGVEG